MRSCHPCCFCNLLQDSPEVSQCLTMAAKTQVLSFYPAILRVRPSVSRPFSQFQVATTAPGKKTSKRNQMAFQLFLRLELIYYWGIEIWGTVEKKGP